MMITRVTGVWFDIGPDKPGRGLKCACLTMKPSCPLYEADEWMRADGKPKMMTAYSCLGEDYNDFTKLLEKETGLCVIEYDTHYILQVYVEMLNQKYTIVQAAKKLQQFVNKHFDSYDEA
jgi:hypothetical protein